MRSSFDPSYRERAATRPAAPPPARSRVPRRWLAGAGIFAATLLGASLLLQAGYLVVAMVYAVLAGLVLLFLCLFLDGRDGGGSFVLGFCGVLIAVATAIVGQDEVVLFGSSARDVVAANAPASGVAFLHFRDAHVLADRMTDVAVYSGSQRQGTHLSYYLKVAPIVDAGWTQDQPVAALAVIGSPQLGHRVAEWRLPLNGGVRLNGSHGSEQAKAARSLQRNERLTLTSDAIFLRLERRSGGRGGGGRAGGCGPRI